MCKICVFAGTTEGRELAGWLADRGAMVYGCVATEYGGTLLEERENLTVSARRLTREEMAALFRERGFDCVVDATHPYAPVVTENISGACGETGTPYLRLLRDSGGLPEDCVYVEDTREAVEYLTGTRGNILLATGSKELAAYAALPDYADRVYARVLPVESSIAACRETGLPVSHILAMQGPFSAELNAAMLKTVDARILVTKESGSKGGFPEKAEAARLAGVTLLVIGRPCQKQGLSYGETVRELSRRFGFAAEKRVWIVGIGPGDREHMTLQAQRAVEEAECLIGAGRMLEAVARPGQTCCEAIAPEKIRQAMDAHPECSRVAVVMAGDVGFYSGTKKLLPLLKDCKVELVPGLSSLVCLCARLGVSYEDVVSVSLHGRQRDVVGALASIPRAFVLVGGENGLGRLCAQLTEGGLGDAKVSVGERLGYPDEKITVGTAARLAEQQFHSLSAALVEHTPRTVVTHGLPDEAFLRGSHADGSLVPMTKREVRAVSLSALELTEDAVCWDIGAGTGSVAIEMALQARRGKVFAIEKKEDAIALLKENIARFHGENITVVPGLAPEACADLPAPTHVFVGGSSGNMAEILNLCREKNPHVRIVATAVALETAAELTRCRKELGFGFTDVVCVTAAHGRKAGPYTLMQGQNPVYVFTFGE